MGTTAKDSCKNNFGFRGSLTITPPAQTKQLPPSRCDGGGAAKARPAPIGWEYLFSGVSWWRSKVLPASRRQIGRSRIGSFCRQDAGSTLNSIRHSKGFNFLTQEGVHFCTLFRNWKSS
jgi:hypothetical protein